MLPGMELMSCPELAVPPEVMHHVVRVESSHNPYAIGVVGGHLVRQPKNLPEALATVRMLESRGFNFSLGVAQVNRYNLDKYGLDSYEKAFQVCPNLQAGSRILAECYSRSGGDWGKSFSCYYSGNFVTGYRHGYVQKIYASMRQTAAGPVGAPQGQAIPVVSKPSRRSVGVTRYPVYAAPSTQASAPATAPAVRQVPPQSMVTPDASQAALMRTSAAPQEQPVILQNMQAGAQPAQAPASAAGSAASQAGAVEVPAVDAAFVF